MQIQVNGEKSVGGNPELSQFVEGEVNRALGRFEGQLTRVEVHLSDANGDKGGVDKRCVIEARPAGHQPLTTSSETADIQQSVKAASDKMKNALETLFGKLDHRR